MDYRIAKKAYNVQKGCYKRRKDIDGQAIEMRMTFQEWADVWLRSGKWDMRGPLRGQYCMARKGDKGHYEVGNVEIILTEENKAFAGKQWERTAETRQKMRDAQLGKRHSAETREKLSKMNKGRPMKRVQCSHCGFETSPQNMSRHVLSKHGEGYTTSKRT